MRLNQNSIAQTIETKFNASNTSYTPLMCSTACTGDDLVRRRHCAIPHDTEFSKHCAHDVMGWLQSDGPWHPEGTPFEHEWIKDEETDDDADKDDEVLESKFT